ncbi:MAG: translation elongation factor Ts, partial [Candidatus Sedimenticola endophacoides]
MAITASLVKELRDRTGSGMMECKKALVETNGDIDAAIENMRKSGQAKAAKKAGRIAAEGIIVIKFSDDGKQAAMVEVNCETDFVAKDENFTSFANAVAERALDGSAASVEE